MITSWTSPRRPIPSDLADQQVARLDGRQDDLDDAALLLLDDAGQDPRPEREDRDEQQDDHADVGEDERRVPVRVGWLELAERRRLLSGRDLGQVDAGSFRTSTSGRPCRPRHDLAERTGVALLDDELGLPAVRRDDEQPVEALVLELRLARRHVGDRLDGDLDAGLVATAGEGLLEPGGRRPDHAERCRPSRRRR